MNLPHGPPPAVLSSTRPNPFIGRNRPEGRGEKQTRLRNVSSVKEELAPHVHDITRALGNKVSEQEIERELSSYLNVYRVSLDTAKRSIVKKHGGNPATLTTGISKTLRELMPGEQSVNLLARIVSVNERDVTVEGGSKRILSVERREVEVDGAAKAVFSGVLADETGKTQFSAWKDFSLKPDEVVRVEGAYVKTWRGIPQVSFDERATITRLKPDLLPPSERLNVSPRMWIEDLAERGGAADVTVRGILIDLREGSGLVYRCPECRRVLRKGACRLHGEVKGEPDLRVKAVLDDGSGALTAVFDRELTEGLLDKSLEACIAAAKEAMSTDVVRDELADILVAQPVEARGNVTSDDYGLMMIVESAKLLKVDVQAEAASALSKLKPPVFGAIVGKSRIYSPQPGTTYTSIRPEVIKSVDESVRDYWILEACRSLQKRLDAMAEAQKMDPPTKEGLVKVGVKEAIADGIVQAVNHYGKVDLSRYLAMLAEGLRYLLPEYREPIAPGEPTVDTPRPIKQEPSREADESEGKVLEIIAALDADGKGAPWEGILETATTRGVSKDSLEESINALLDKGLIYEPILGRMKKI